MALMLFEIHRITKVCKHYYEYREAERDRVSIISYCHSIRKVGNLRHSI